MTATRTVILRGMPETDGDQRAQVGFDWTGEPIVYDNRDAVTKVATAFRQVDREDGIEVWEYAPELYEPPARPRP